MIFGLSEQRGPCGDINSPSGTENEDFHGRKERKVFDTLLLSLCQRSLSTMLDLGPAFTPDRERLSMGASSEMRTGNLRGYRSVKPLAFSKTSREACAARENHRWVTFRLIYTTRSHTVSFLTERYVL